jgi:hypothetical protein
MDKRIKNITARFHTGGQDERYCDCLGLLLLHFQYNEIPFDGRLIPRGKTKYQEVRIILKQFCNEVKRDGQEWLICLSRLGNEDGHIGIYFSDENLVYHMSPWGVQAFTPGENEEYWELKSGN